VPLVLFIGSAYRYFRAKLTEFDDPDSSSGDRIRRKIRAR
jgi:hypothetical protein